jgi:hypothetical protein
MIFYFFINLNFFSQFYFKVYISNTGKKVAGQAEPEPEVQPAQPTMPEISQISAREGTSLAPGVVFWPGMN